MELGAKLFGGAHALATEQHTFDLRLVIFQYEISVTRRGLAEIGNLAFDPQRADALAEHGFDFEVKRRNGPDGFGGGLRRLHAIESRKNQRLF